MMEKACKEQSLDSSFDVTNIDMYIEPGYSSRVAFEKKGKEKCPFDCMEVGMSFDTGSCKLDVFRRHLTGADSEK
jgi:hypothetical protein